MTTAQSDRVLGDAVVVGAGLAGLAAAATLVDAGRSVAIIEALGSPGGSTAMSGGWFAFSGTEDQAAAGFSDSDALFLEDMRIGSGHRADEALLEAYIAHQRPAYEWLKSVVPDIGALKVSSGQSAARSHQFDVHAFTAHLRRRLEEAGAPVRFGHRATSLRTDGRGRVVGVDVETPRGPEAFDARGGVILTSGGFSRSTELLEIFAPEQLAGIPHGGLGNHGDGLKMAWRLGAGMRDLGYVAGTYGSHPETGDKEHELLTGFYMGAVIVNSDGRRFIDESASYKTLGAACLGQPDGLGFQVFDARIRARSQPGVPLSDIDRLEAKGRLLRGESIEGLALLAGIAPEALSRTIERYNSAVRGDAPDEFGRSGLCNGVGDLVPIDTPPFYAYPARTLMTSTYAGLTVTPETEVLAIDGERIPGLYAAGEVVGGFHGTAYMTGTALGKALIFGRVAGETMDRALLG